MDRREMMTRLVAASALMTGRSDAASMPNKFIELKTWRLHNTPENQGARLSEYLERGLAPALSATGATLAGAFSVSIGPDSPSYVTLSQYSSLSQMQEVLEKLNQNPAHRSQLQKLNGGPGLPFVRVESCLLRCFDFAPQINVQRSDSSSSRIFEMRTYESQSFSALTRKIAMFNEGEAQIFDRLGFRPVFFGETIIGSRQPNLTYMLSYDDLASRARLWKTFVDDPAWKMLIANPELQDPQIVANITNVILSPLSFSQIR